MLKRTFVTIAAAAGVFLAASPFVVAQDDSTQIPETTLTAPTIGYASVNGLDMYYEIHGTGEPLVLLPCGLGTVDTMFAAILPTLAQTHQVIAIELQGHGHTADIDRPLSYEAMADDVAAMITQLGFENADIMGYSLGGGVALQTAIRHPEVVRKLIIISAVYARNGWYPELLPGMLSLNAQSAREMMGSSVYKTYINVAPRPEDWPVLITKLGELLKQDYDWSEDVAVLKMPVLIVVGDADSVRLAHAVEMFGLLGGGKADGESNGLPKSQFAVLPSTLHGGSILNAALLLPVVTPFLEVPMPR